MLFVLTFAFFSNVKRQEKISNEKIFWHNMLFVHRMVLSTFRPIHAKCMQFCDHINRKRHDNRLANLRWSNVVLNGMNKRDVRGWCQVRTMYCPECKVLDRRYRFGACETSEEAEKVYWNFQTRAFEVIEALMKRDIPVEIQRLILDYWLQRLRGRAGTPMREAWLESNASLWSPQKSAVSQGTRKGGIQCKSPQIDAKLPLSDPDLCPQMT